MVIIDIVSHWVVSLVDLFGVKSLVLLISHKVVSLELDGLSNSENKGDICEFVHFYVYKNSFII